MYLNLLRFSTFIQGYIEIRNIRINVNQGKQKQSLVRSRQDIGIQYTLVLSSLHAMMAWTSWRKQSENLYCVDSGPRFGFE